MSIDNCHKTTQKIKVNKEFEYMRATLNLLCLCAILSFPFVFLVFIIRIDLNVFILLGMMGITEFFIYAGQCMISPAVIWSVEYKNRPLALSIDIFVKFVIGSVIGPIVVGTLIDWQKSKTNDEKEAYQYIMTVISWVIVANIVTFLLARVLTTRKLSTVQIL